MSPHLITCPKCHHQFALDDVLKHEVEEQREQFNRNLADKEEEFREKEKKLKEKEKQLELSQKSIEEQVQEKVKQEKTRLEKEALQKVSKDKEEEMNLLTEQWEETKKKLGEAQKNELELRKKQNQLEEDKKAFELEKQRQLDEAKKELQEIAEKKAQETHHLKDAEKEKKIQDMQKIIEDLQRKAQQGSQQTQGEVLELELEELLKTTFPYDEIIPVAKGVQGADIIQKVHNTAGRLCGTIIWESKHTKSWSEPWILKLKDNQREAKAEIAVIVSTVLPEDVKTFIFRDGVWISGVPTVIGLAMALRTNLIQLAMAKLASVGKNEKMEVLYNYLTGTEFQHRVEAIVETFVSMKEDLESEKRAYTKQWAKREKQIQRVIDSTVGMHGDLEGLIGNALPQIKMLEPPEEEED